MQFRTKVIVLGSVAVSVAVFAMVLRAIQLEGNLPLSKMWPLQGVFFLFMFTVAQPLFSFAKNRDMRRQVRRFLALSSD